MILDYMSFSYDALAKVKEVSSDYSFTHEYLIANTRAFWRIVRASMEDPRCYRDFYVGNDPKIHTMVPLLVESTVHFETQLNAFADQQTHTIETYENRSFFQFPFDMLTFRILIILAFRIFSRFFTHTSAHFAVKIQCELVIKWTNFSKCISVKKDAWRHRNIYT